MRLGKVKNSRYWYVWFGRDRVSTKCEDETAARLVAIQIERSRVIVQLLDADGTLAQLLVDHLNRRGHVVKDRAPVGVLGRVYFVACPAKNLIKIGFATDLKKRMSTLRVSATDEIHLLASFPGTRRAERHLHGKFMASRKFGEWFEDTPELRAHIKEVAGKGLVASQWPAEEAEARDLAKKHGRK